MRFIIITKRQICVFLLALLMAITLIIGGYSKLRAVSSTTSGTLNDGIKVPILMYHSILKDPKSAGKYVISPDLFKKDMMYLIDNGYETIFISQLVDYVYEDKELPKKPVIVTFDDGYLNNMTYILPILEELNLKATFSVVGIYSNIFSESSDPNPAYAHVTWDDIKVMYDSGHFEIGNHTYDMHKSSPRKGSMKMSGEDTQKYQNIFRADVGKLQDILTEKSGVTPIVYTYPFGHISPEALPVIKDMGFKAALTCSEKVNYITKSPEQLYSLCRFNRPNGISTESFMKKALGE